MGLNFTSSDIFVYIHIPFCTKRCFYCDFTSTTNLSLVEDYFKALSSDIRSAENFFKDRTIRTIYFGGGTPSLIDPSYIRDILKILRGFNYDPVEITIELNPESTTRGNLVEYKDMGINRISLGVQAFDNEVLNLSGRPHGIREIIRALDHISYVFENFNLDFIVGLPGYDEKVIDANLELVEKFDPSHVSVYTLEIHEDTPIYKMYTSGKLDLPENTMELFFKMVDGLKKLGYERYEISNFAKNNSYSVHNLSYWYSMNYLGFGVSAGGYFESWRYVKTPNIRKYIKNPSALFYEKKNSLCEDSREILFMGLRLLKGVPESKISVKDMIERISDHIIIKDGNIIARNVDDPDIFEIVSNFNCLELEAHRV